MILAPDSSATFPPYPHPLGVGGIVVNLRHEDSSGLAVVGGTARPTRLVHICEPHVEPAEFLATSAVVAFADAEEQGWARLECGALSGIIVARINPIQRGAAGFLNKAPILDRKDYFF